MSVIAVSVSPTHTFSKPPASEITLIPNLGVEGDCHLGATVQHRSRLHIKPPPENLRQVHLIPLSTLTERGLQPGEMGENIVTDGLDLLGMRRGTKLRFLGAEDVDSGEVGDEVGDKAPTIVITGLRNPCTQIDKYRKGLQETFVVRVEDRKIVQRLAGVMATVQVGGLVKPGMKVEVIEPPNDGEHGPLEPV